MKHDEHEERLNEWLRDAYAMEQQAITMLNGMASRIKHYPSVQKKVSEHLEETKRQAEQVKACIERRGGSTSALKTAAAKFTGLMQAASGMFVGDEIIKGGLASYTFEHMEIASYEILIAAAETLGDNQTKTVCEGILRQEEVMADWLAEHLPQVTTAYLRREAADMTATR